MRVSSAPVPRRHGAPARRAVAGAFQRMIELGVAARNRPRVDANLFGHPLAERRQTDAKGFPFRAAAHAATIPSKAQTAAPGGPAEHMEYRMPTIAARLGGGVTNNGKERANERTWRGQHGSRRHLDAG